MVVSVSLIRNGYGYGTVPGGRWAIDTERGHGKFRIPNAIATNHPESYLYSQLP